MSTFFCSIQAGTCLDHLYHGFAYVEVIKRPRRGTVETPVIISVQRRTSPNLSPPPHRPVLSTNPSAHAGAQARAGNLWVGGVCRIRQGTSAASGGVLPDGATIPFNSGSQDAPEHGGTAIRIGGPPSSCIVGRRRPHPTTNFSEALPPRSLVSRRLLPNGRGAMPLDPACAAAAQV